MAKYSREYAITQGWNTWQTNLEDEFINLKYKRKTIRTKRKKVCCDGFDITEIKVTARGERFVMIHETWLPFPQAIRQG